MKLRERVTLGVFVSMFGYIASVLAKSTALWIACYVVAQDVLLPSLGFWQCIVVIIAFTIIRHK